MTVPESASTRSSDSFGEDAPFRALLAEAARASSIPLSELAPHPRLEPGDTLLEGRFTIRRVLGAGASGVAYEAHDRERGDVIALKSLQRSDPSAILRFKGEFRALSCVVHPRLVRLHGLYVSEGCWFFTMDLVHGVPFTRALEKIPGSAEDRFDCLRRALLSLTDGVSAIHRAGKLHRDLKPSNVLVCRDGHVTIVDYGLVVDATAEEPAGALAGTAGYIAPERYAGCRATPASDWYSVGIMLRQVLALEPSAVPEDLRQVCAGLSRVNPAERFGESEVRARLAEGTVHEPSALASGPAPFVGRLRELAALRDAYQATLRGNLVVSRVCGPSGIGKTTLVQAFLDELGDAATVLSGRCREREFTPRRFLEGVVDALAARLEGVRLEESPDTARSFAALGRLFPTSCRLPAVAKARQWFEPSLHAAEQRRRAVRGLAILLARVSANRILVIHVDDAQWADVDGTALLTELLESSPPLLLLVTHRSDEHSEALEALFASLHQNGTDVRQLDVAGLESEEIRELSRQLGVVAKHSERIARESRGHPYFALELARFTNGIPRDDAGCPDLDEVLAHRIRAQPQAVQELLVLVAVAAAPLALRTLASAARELDRSVWILRAERLVRIRLVNDREQIDVYHDRVREVVLAGLDAERSRRTHLALAGALEATCPEQVELLSTHHSGAGQMEHAARYAILAARKAVAVLAFERAADWYSKALRDHQWSPLEARGLWGELGDVLAQAGRNSAAADAYGDAIARSSEPQPTLELQRAAQLLYSGRFLEGLPALESALVDTRWPLPARADVPAAMRLLPEAWWRMRLGRVRSAEDIPKEELARVDACFWAALGLGGDSRGVSVYMMMRAGLEALRVAEPLRIVRVAQFTAAMAVSDHGFTGRVATAALELSTRAERHVSDSRVEFWHAFRRTWRGFWLFDPEGMARQWAVADALVERHRYHGVDRERVLLGIIGCIVAMQHGEGAAFHDRLSRFQEEARLRRDEYAAAFGELLDLRSFLDGDAVLRRSELKEMIERRQRSAGKLMALLLTDAELQLARCERCLGDEEGARARALRALDETRRTLAFGIPRMRSEVLREAASCSLALAVKVKDRRALLRHASSLIRDDPAPASWQSPGRAALAWLSGDHELALRHLEAASASEGVLGAWIANAARAVSGGILGGTVGRGRAARAEWELRRAGFRDPRIAIRIAMPGLPVAD